MDQSGSGGSRRLQTPERNALGRSGDKDHRSRSRLRSVVEECRSCTRRSRSSTQYDGCSRYTRDKERALEREREKVRRLEEEIDRERSRLQSRSRSRSRAHTRCSASLVRSPGWGKRLSQKDDKDRRRSSRKSTSPAISTKDLVNIFKSMKFSQPSTAAQTLSNLNHRNILPDFDPSSKNQRIDIWLRKINECATVYGWDDKTIVHFAMQKLQGLAKTWYEGLNSILFNWSEWQEKLLSAFPCEQNFGPSLEDMLKWRSIANEPIEIYFYEKIALLNQCDIVGKRAVDCVIHGLSDKTLQTSALALRCTEPDQLLRFLMSNKDTVSMAPSVDRANFKNRFTQEVRPSNSYSRDHETNSTVSNSALFCYSCKERGHPVTKCPKPLVKCLSCNKFGHKSENCYLRPESEASQKADKA